MSAMILSLYIVPFSAECSDHTVGEVDDLIGGIVSYKLGQAGAGSTEEWLGNGIAEGAGTATDWYALTLSQCGYTDLSAYERSLTEYIGSNNISSATSREKYALALCAAGSDSSYISDILDSSIGEQGMMSWIYGLHILNNGYTCSRFTAESVVDTILSMQYDDGGWALFGRIGASDDLVNGESTFMVEMKEANFALQDATPNSLILFDELGRGTATYDGMSLAQAILEYIHDKIKAKTLFSTHYTGLP